MTDLENYENANVALRAIALIKGEAIALGEKMKRLIYVGVAILTLPGSASAGPWQVAQTPSGRPEAIFLGLTPEEASGKLVDGCINAGWIVVSSTPNEVKCEVKLNFGQQLMKELFQGNQYSTPVKQYLRTTLSKTQDGARVQAYLWDENQFAFGQVRTTPQDGDVFRNRMQDYLVSSGGKLPVGTTFPNFAYIGAETKVAEASYKGQLAKGMEITSLTQDGTGAALGLQTGDVIMRLSNKRTDKDGELLEALNKAGRDGTTTIEAVRGADVITLSGAVVFRKAINAYNPSDYPPRPPEPTVTIAAPAPTAADELLKYGQLLEKGLITEDEYNAQKKRLLSQ